MANNRFNQTPGRLPKPAWLRRALPRDATFESTRKLIGQSCLSTVCQEAQCPNIWECYSVKTATFMILGRRCTRHCGFCAVAKDPVDPPDLNEPDRIAAAVQKMGLAYITLTSVTRDDLPDGGASAFVNTIHSVRAAEPRARIEVLIPDFNGNFAALKAVVDAKPDVLNHNLETVQRLYQRVRPEADYDRSLNLIREVTQLDRHLPVKSGMMLGLGETGTEVEHALTDLFEAGCQMMTLGQYLAPSAGHLPVVEYIAPEVFAKWKAVAAKIGFAAVASGPFVRSSYQADKLYRKLENR